MDVRDFLVAKPEDDLVDDDAGEVMESDIIFNDRYREIDPEGEDDEIPEEGESWVLPPLYKTGATGHMHKFQIGYDSISKKILWTVVNLATGNVRLYNQDVVPTKAQKGSYTKKAHQEALQRTTLKIREGFHREASGSSQLPIPLPMLAYRYEPPTESSAGNTPNFPMIAQVKFDGERHLVYDEVAPPHRQQVKALSRKMIERPHFNHIREECGRLLEFLPPRTVLDGELYSPAIGFQLTTSIAGSKNVCHARERELDYYLFDIMHPSTVWKPGIGKTVREAHAGDGDRGYVYVHASGYTVEDFAGEATEYVELPQGDDVVLRAQDGSPLIDISSPSATQRCITFGEILEGNPMWVVEVRIALIMNAFRCFRARYGSWPKHVHLVKSWIIHNRSDIARLFAKVRAIKTPCGEKLEGIMLRHLARGNADPTLSLYRPGRSKNLLKVKEQKTTEVIITGVKPGKGLAKDLATLTYREPDTGLTGTLVPAGTHQERREMLLNPSSVKGRIMTVSYQNRLKSGAMRFPVGEAFLT